MTYRALARKYRPQTFSDIIGQETIVRTLQNAIEQNRIHHAYLFSGVRGVGKTTTARIFAKALNCVHGPAAEPCNECTICKEITEGIDLDVREIDAATYTQVDNIRELREVTQFQPARDRKRIYIIDEAHMLSTPAWNALLKLIEEPPPHVSFMLATTEMQKVPATILSRVQQFVFRKITNDEVLARLEEICRAEKIDAERDALAIIARRGEGSVRDSLSMLDQVIAFAGGKVTVENVVTILGLSDQGFFGRLAIAIVEGDTNAILDTLDEAALGGRDFKLLYRDFLAYLRALLLLSAGARESLIPMQESEITGLREIATKFTYTELLRILNLLLADDELVTKGEQQRLAVEIALLKAATLPRLRSVEQAIGGGAGVEQKSGAAPRPRESAPRNESRPAELRATLPRENEEPSPANDPLQLLLREVGEQKKLVGSYLQQAKSSSVSDAAIVFRFDPADRFAYDYLSEGSSAKNIESIAAKVFGRPMKVTFELTSSEEKKGTPNPRAALDNDTVVQAFVRHLGGEVVQQKNSK